MAEGKKSFVAYCEWLESFEELSDEEAGKLVKHLFRYVNDLNPEPPDKLTKVMFIPIKQSLKRDLVKYEERAERSRENGKRGGRPSKEEPKKPSGFFQNPEEPKKPDSVNDNVNDNVNVKKNIEDRKTEFYNSLLPFVDEFGKVMIREFFDYWSEHGERDRKFRMEKEKVFDIYKRLTRWKLKANTFVNKETPQVYTKPKLYN